MKQHQSNSTRSWAPGQQCHGVRVAGNVAAEAWEHHPAYELTLPSIIYLQAGHWFQCGLRGQGELIKDEQMRSAGRAIARLGWMRLRKGLRNSYTR